MTDYPDLIARLRATASIAYEDADFRVHGVCLEAADALEALVAENAKWQELHRVIAEEIGTNKETWPDHGNAPLAIAATFMLHKRAAEHAESESARLMAELTKALGERDEERRDEELCRRAADRLRAEVEALRAAIDAYLVANDPSGFGCACEPQTDGHPGFICGPCRAHIAQAPLYAAIDAAMKEGK